MSEHDLFTYIVILAIIICKYQFKAQNTNRNYTITIAVLFLKKNSELESLYNC